MPQSPQPTKPRIVIVGGGFAGAYTAQRLERKLGAGEADVVMLDRNNYFVFSPLLIEAGTGALEPRHAVVSIREFVRQSRFVQGDVIDIDTKRRHVRFRQPGRETPESLGYDHLILTPGSVTNLPDVPGLTEYGYGMKNLSDAVRLRDRTIQSLELADTVDDPDRQRALLHTVVVGANFTGVEVVGELQAFLASAVKRYPRVDPSACKVTLVELTDRILLSLEDPGLSEFAENALRRRGIEIVLETTVERIEQDRVHLSDGRMLASQTVIWCAGIAPSPLVAALDLPTDKRGYILCERDLRVQGHDNVWAIGDAAVNIDAEGKPYPPTAQHAVAQAKALADNVADVVRGREACACDIRSKGTLVALGCRTGVARVMGFKLSGFVAWWLWRTVYLAKMPGWFRRIRIAIDWTLNLAFGREVVATGLAAGQRAPRYEAVRIEEQPVGSGGGSDRV